MARRKIRRWLLHIVAPLAVMAGLGCETELDPSTTPSRGYTFVRDFDSERRTLRIGLTPDEDTQCALGDLPTKGPVDWKSASIDPAIHDHLTELSTDEERIPFYLADTLAVECNEWNCNSVQGEPPEGCEPAECIEVAICLPRETGEYCYLPEVSASVRGAPWRFSLGDDFPEISTASWELIDAFLEAHEACWNE